MDFPKPSSYWAILNPDCNPTSHYRLRQPAPQAFIRAARGVRGRFEELPRHGEKIDAMIYPLVIEQLWKIAHLQLIDVDFPLQNGDFP